MAGSVQTWQRTSLLEVVAVSEGQLLAVLDNGNVPGPQVLDLLAVLGRVELGELVALPVGGDIERGDVLLAADEEDTADDAVVVDTVDTADTEEVLAGGLETGEETTYSLDVRTR